MTNQANCLVRQFTLTAKACFLGLIVLEFNDMSTIVGHFVSTPREKEKKEIVEEMKE